MKSKININWEQITVINAGARGQRSNKRRVSIAGFEARVIIQVGGVHEKLYDRRFTIRYMYTQQSYHLAVLRHRWPF